MEAGSRSIPRVPKDFVMVMRTHLNNEMTWKSLSASWPEAAFFRLGNLRIVRAHASKASGSLDGSGRGRVEDL